MSWGLGPVFVYSWLMASRRWQMFAARAALIALLLVALAWCWWAMPQGAKEPPRNNFPISYRSW